jgi:O-antigen/teichoic acid export membrane protein
MKNRKLNVELRGLVNLYKMSYGYFITTIINQALPFLILPILTRYLSPAEYGSLAVFGFYLAISNSLTSVSISAVISKHFFSTDKKHIAEIIGNSILIVGLISLITISLILISYPFLQSYLNLPLLWLVLIPFASFAVTIYSMGLNVLRNSKKVLTFGKHQVGNTVINLFISLILVVVLFWGWHGRALGILFSYFISALISFCYLKKNGFVSFAISRKQIINILKVVIPLIPNSFQSVIIAQVGIFFIQYYFTKELLGLYAIGFQLAIIIQLLVSTLSMSWSPYLYEQISNENKINKLYLARLFYTLFGVLIAGVLFINICSGLILRIMTTPEFIGSNEFIPWFTLGFFFQGLYELLYPILIKNDKQKYISMVSFVNMFIIIILNVLFLKLFGYIGVAYAFCLTNFVMFIAFFWKAQKVMPLPWLRALKIYS